MALITRKKLPLLLHIFAWSIVILLPMYFFSIEANRDSFFIQMVIIRTFIYVTIFYLNFFWLIPLLLFKNRKWQYYSAIISIIIVFFFINHLINYFVFFQDAKKNKEEIEKTVVEYKIPNQIWKYDIYNYFFTCTLISGFSLGLRMSARFQENEEKRKEMEKEMLGSELAFLKTQISPHFFFNTLNNIYSLTEINTKEAQNAILQLSKLMRYLLYESEKGDIKLSGEIGFMKNYIELMKLRLSEKVELTFSFPENYKDSPFPPLLFVSFIENAFKHGISYRDASFINIDLNVKENQIQFACKNSIGSKVVQNEDSGIGLENVKKRLALLFPDKHQLSIVQTDTVYSVELNISI